MGAPMGNQNAAGPHGGRGGRSRRTARQKRNIAKLGPRQRSEIRSRLYKVGWKGR